MLSCAVCQQLNRNPNFTVYMLCCTLLYTTDHGQFPHIIACAIFMPRLPLLAAELHRHTCRGELCPMMSETSLHLYRPLILSKLQCGCIVHGCARSSYQWMFDPVQNHALCLCLGAYRTSPASHFISEMMQDRAIITMEGEYETVPKLSNGTSLNDLQ